MRATRAFVGAFGAGISLAVASSLVLLVVSSVVAFNGWPDDLTGSGAPDVARLADAAAAGTAGPAALELPDATSVRRERATSDGDVTESTRVAGAQDIATGPDASVAPGTTGASTPTTSSSTPSQPTGEPVSRVKPVTDVVRDTTKVVGETVAPVAPAAGGALESVGAAGAESVDQVGKTVDGAMQTLLP